MSLVNWGCFFLFLLLLIFNVYIQLYGYERPFAVPSYIFINARLKKIIFLFFHFLYCFTTFTVLLQISLYATNSSEFNFDYYNYLFSNLSLTYFTLYFIPSQYLLFYPSFLPLLSISIQAVVLSLVDLPICQLITFFLLDIAISFLVI